MCLLGLTCFEGEKNPVSRSHYSVILDDVEEVPVETRLVGLRSVSYSVASVPNFQRALSDYANHAFSSIVF